jgi:hypothetical protein
MKLNATAEMVRICSVFLFFLLLLFYLFTMCAEASISAFLFQSLQVPVTWPEVCNIHPFAPADQWEGYQEMIDSLSSDLAKITGFAGISQQPNSGAQVGGSTCFFLYR